LSEQSLRRLLEQLDAMVAAEEAKSAWPAPGAMVIDATLEQSNLTPRSYLVDSKR